MSLRSRGRRVASHRAYDLLVPSFNIVKKDDIIIGVLDDTTSIDQEHDLID